MSKYLIRAILTTGLCALVGNSSAFAQMYKVGSSDAVPAEELFKACGFCHGAQGQGRQRLDAPALAGLPAWYVARQMHNFKSGVRGAHADDLPGSQMAMITGMFRNEATIAGLATFIEKLAPGAPPMKGPGGQTELLTRPFTWKSQYATLNATQPGDAAKGKTLYLQSCLACHGADGQGIEALGAPRLTVQSPWYLGRQLKYFRSDVRGAHPKDTFGAQMAPFAKMLPDDQAIADVLAYIHTL